MDEVTTRPECETCQAPLSFRWTDTHGIGVCSTCGTPYRLYHYDEATNQRLDKPPMNMLDATGKVLAVRYWNEHRRMVFPAAFDMGMERHGRTYSGATGEDCHAFGAWYSQQPEALAREAAGTEAAS